MNSTRIHITGATGFLGRELAAQAPGATGERADVRDDAALTALFGRVRPSVVIHTAYRQSGGDEWAVNVEGSEHVARAAWTVGARLIHVSSDVVFDGLAGRPYVESDAPTPVNAYGRSKAEAERRVHKAHGDALIVRTSLIIGGPGYEPSRHERVAAEQDTVFFDDELRSPIQVGDLASALLELATLDLTGVLHVAGADDVSRAQLAERVTGRTVRSAPAPPGRPLDCRLDSSRARGLLRTRLRGVREVYA